MVTILGCVPGEGLTAVEAACQEALDHGVCSASVIINILARKAAAKRLQQRYENGVLIVETGDMVTFAVPEVEPLITDTLMIDGVECVITNLTAIPPAGTVVAYKAWCAA